MLKATFFSALSLVLALMAGGVANAQTATTTPGVPNTGIGGDPAMMTAILSVAGLAALLGIAFLATRKTT